MNGQFSIASNLPLKNIVVAEAKGFADYNCILFDLLRQVDKKEGKKKSSRCSRLSQSLNLYTLSRIIVKIKREKEASLEVKPRFALPMLVSLAAAESSESRMIVFICRRSRARARSKADLKAAAGKKTSERHGEEKGWRSGYGYLPYRESLSHERERERDEQSCTGAHRQDESLGDPEAEDGVRGVAVHEKQKVPMLNRICRRRVSVLINYYIYITLR